MTDWQQNIQEWRALSPEEKLRRRWASIPLSVARSFAAAGEPVDLAALEAAHAQRIFPSVGSVPNKR